MSDQRLHSDIVFIRNLQFDTIIGVLPDERTTPQPICINLEVAVDTATAATSERLEDTLDYAALAEAVKVMTIESQCLLVETLAEQIAQLTLKHSRVSAVTVDVMKPAALAEADGVGVRIYRTAP